MQLSYTEERSRSIKGEPSCECNCIWMTCIMAADHQKRRLTSSNLLEQNRGRKKKKLKSSVYILNLRSHIYLEWDGTQKRVVAKKEQIGIAWTDMAPFVHSVSHSLFGLADIFSVPQEIFGLVNLSEVLSYEVWETFLSESERKLLIQFLPSGADAEQVVRPLLKGENHHFGNPYFKWSASLCSSNLHPDVILQRNRQCRADRKAYNSEITKYKTGMLNVLNKLKQRWMTCKDPEKFWKSEVFTRHKQESLLTPAKMAKAAAISKKEIPPKICIHNGDAAKNTSYSKITEKQLKLVKNIKHSGEEEMKKLHTHWLQVATKDIPRFFQERRDKIVKREQWGKSLAEALSEKKKLIMDGDKETKDQENLPQEHVDEESEHPPTNVLDQAAIDSILHSTHNHNAEHIPSLGGHQEHSPNILDEATTDQDIPKVAETSSHLCKFFGNQDAAVNVKEPEASISSSEDMWQVGYVQDSYYRTTAESSGYMPVGGFSLRQPHHTDDLPPHVIDLERDKLEQEAGDSVASSLPMDIEAALFYSYSNQDHNELLPNFPKSPGTLSCSEYECNNNLKQPELQFLMPNDGLYGSGEFSHQFQEQPPLLEQRQVCEKELYMHQMKNNVCTNDKYLAQGYSLSTDQHGLAAFQSSLNGRFVGQSGFPDEHEAGSHWSVVQLAGSRGQYYGNGGNADGSLYSVLSHCSTQPSFSPYGIASSEQSIQAGNYYTGHVPNDGNLYTNANHQLKNPSGLDPAAPSSLTSAPWIDFTYQNPGLRDSGGRNWRSSNR